MTLLETWGAWARRRERDLLYTVLQLAWWLADGGSTLGSLRAVFRGSAQCLHQRAVRPRRQRRGGLQANA
jgi:hypothetical protein